MRCASPRSPVAFVADPFVLGRVPVLGTTTLHTDTADQHHLIADAAGATFTSAGVGSP